MRGFVVRVAVVCGILPFVAACGGEGTALTAAEYRVEVRP